MDTRDFVSEFVLECQLRRLSKRTIKGYHNNTALFLTFIENEYQVTRLEKIRPLHIRGYMQHIISRKLSPSYANGILKCLRAFFKYAYNEEYITVNPCEKVSWQKEGKVIIQAFTEEEVKRLILAFPFTDYLSARNRLIMILAFDTGARNSEICGICPSDIRDNVILIHGKGNKERCVPLTPLLKKTMKRYERIKESYFFNQTTTDPNYFLSRTGKALTKEAIEHIFNQANEKACVRSEIRCSPHTARHYYAQANIRNGLDVYSLSRLLGHENINITKRYLQSLQDENIVEMAVETSPLSKIKL